MKSIFRILLLLFFGLLLLLILTLRLRYGGGEAYPDLSTSPLLPKAALETVFSYPEPLGNLSVSESGRIFFTVHPESRPTGPKVLEIRNGKAIPYPDVQQQSTLYNTVLSLRVDRFDRLWVLDHGQHGFEGARLLAFDLQRDSLLHDHYFSKTIAPRGSFFNDFQVAPDGNTIYIADVNFFGKKPALVVYDVETRTARRVLERHPSTYPQDWIITTPQQRMTFLGGLVALKPGIDGITLDLKGEWLYYGAMTHDGLFKVSTTDLKDTGLGARELSARIVRVGTKPLSDGLSIDSLDQIYITDVEHAGLALLQADGTLQTLIRDEERIRWADGCSFGPDGYLYFTDSAIPDQMLRSKKHMQSHAPYYIYRIKVPHSGQFGQ